MSGNFVKWILIVVVIGIWVNMLRVSIPSILDYFSNNFYKEIESYSAVSFEVNPANQSSVDINSLRNPFAKWDKNSIVNSKVGKVEGVKVEKPKPYSLFNFKGSFLVNGKRVAVLEGRSDLGFGGTFYVSEGETVMNEKILEIGENYVIIFKDGEKIILYEVK